MFTARWAVEQDGGLRAYVFEDDKENEVVAESLMYPILGEVPELLITKLDKNMYSELLLRLMLFKAKETGLKRYYISAPDSDGAFLSRFGFVKSERNGESVYFADESTVDLTSACHREEAK